MIHKSTSDEHTNLLLTDITENLDRINISCDQITFNPLDETVTITACKVKPGIHNINKTYINKTIDPKDDEITLQVNTPEEDVNYYEWSDHMSVGDVICLGSIVMLILIWLSVFIFYEVFYEIKDIESSAIDHKIINKDGMDDETAMRM